MAKSNLRTKRIAVLAVSIALIVVLQAIAEGLQVLGLQISLALGMIPVLVVAQFEDWKGGLCLGLAFGITSMLIAVIRYSGVPVWSHAINPLVSVLPRAIVGVVVALLSTLIRKKQATKAVATEVKAEAQAESTPSAEIKSAKGAHHTKIVSDYFLSAVVTLCGVLLNTVGFLGMFLAFAGGESTGGYVINMAYVLALIVSLNTIIESVTFVVIVPAIVGALRHAKLLNR